MTGGPDAAALRTVVHLVRHGEVHNPDGVLYGRLSGFGLTPRGADDATAAAERLRPRDVAHLAVSPLERARTTAEPLAEALGVEAVVDERITEATSALEGRRVDLRRSLLRQPAVWPVMWNPWRPSWGEPYAEVVARMWEAVDEARAVARGREAVLVSHQMPIWVTRRRAEGRRLAHHPRHRQCETASITSLHFAGDEVTGIDYWEPGDPPGGRADPSART